MSEALTKGPIVAGGRQRGKDGGVDQSSALLICQSAAWSMANISGLTGT